MAETYDLSNPLGPTIVKDPDAKLDYSVDIADWLSAVGDSIASFTATAAAPLVLTSPSHASGVMTVWVAGGLAGTTKQVTFRFTTAGGRIDERSIFLKIRQR